ENFEFRFINAGKSRGGFNKTGGIIWCDYSEFVDIPNTKQIFGHTIDNKVRRVKNKKICSEHICLDTVMRNYAVYQDGKMTIKSAKQVEEKYHKDD
ncbi:MAG: hypothetical protein ACE5RO_06540, partial [Candidatus Nitrosomaritimum yanchengensis]